MAYGDKIGFRNIKTSKLVYKKPSANSSFDTNYIYTYYITESGWCYTLEFDTRKDWFKFVRHVNKLNKEFKKMKNIEKED